MLQNFYHETKPINLIKCLTTKSSHIRSIYDSLTLQVYYQSMITNVQTCVNLFKQRKQNKKVMFYLHGALQLSEYVHASYRDVYNRSKRYTDPVSSPQKTDFRREHWCPERMSDLSEVTQLVGLKLTCLDNSSFFYESKLQICNRYSQTQTRRTTHMHPMLFQSKVKTDEERLM